MIHTPEMIVTAKQGDKTIKNVRCKLNSLRPLSVKPILYVRPPLLLYLTAQAALGMIPAKRHEGDPS
jgi:hypothetical protein